MLWCKSAQVSPTAHLAASFHKTNALCMHDCIKFYYATSLVLRDMIVRSIVSLCLCWFFFLSFVLLIIILHEK